MRKLALAVGLVVGLGVTAPAHAVIGGNDDVPAATLLLPYFQVDPDGTAATGTTTLMSINNASATAILAHVTVWSDLAVPVMAFNMYLTGFDAQTLDLQQVLTGHLPRTASAGQDQQDMISPHGDFSQDINFASCTGQLPPPDTLDPDFIAHIRASLSGGNSSLLGGCAGRSFGDTRLRGYITVDTVNNCTLRFPGDPGYFAPGGSGDVTLQNVLWGDYLQIDRATGKANADNLVAIEASFTDPLVTTPGNYTFYGRLVDFNASDGREPLGTAFALRYFNTGAGFPRHTTLVGWRDPKIRQIPFACGTNPPWFPLSQEQIVVFDEEENPELPPSSPVAPPPPGTVLIPFPGATQRVRIGSSDFPVGFQRGWVFLNLNTAVTGSTNPPMHEGIAQAWVTLLQVDADTAAYGVRGHTTIGYRAIQLQNASSFNNYHVGF
jgi:hypothetical protein